MFSSDAVLNPEKTFIGIASKLYPHREITSVLASPKSFHLLLQHLQRRQVCSVFQRLVVSLGSLFLIPFIEHTHSPFMPRSRFTKEPSQDKRGKD